MTLGMLLRRSLAFHGRSNLAVLLGVAVGTAVLTGALLVGDSLRGSLRAATEEQLGWVENALTAPRFVREALADHLGASRLGPAILLQGSARCGGAEVRRAGRVTIWGTDARLGVPGEESFWNSEAEEVVLNAALADELGARAGDKITLQLQKVSDIPRESLLGHSSTTETLDQLELTVRAVLPNRGAARLNLYPTPAVPRNAFVPLRLLQKRLGQPGRVNAFLVGTGPTREELQTRLREHLTLEDWGLTLHTPASRAEDLFAKLDRNRDGMLRAAESNRRVAETFVQEADADRDKALSRAEVATFYASRRAYLSLESRQMLLEPAAERTALAAAEAAGLRAAPTLVYLANSIALGTEAIPYSVVLALDPTLPPPLGPALPAFGDDEIVLADWPDTPLRPGAGNDTVQLTYFLSEKHGKYEEGTASFRLRGLVPLTGAANDPDLTPEFPGITDKLDLRSWNPPFPYDNKRVLPRDERYWQLYRTAPKAYVTLARGQQLWASRFGQLTSIRMAPKEGTDLAKATDAFRAALLARLDPEQGGLVFDPVRQRGLAGSGGFTDFGGLFLGFSCFLIVAALLLVGLMYRLNLDRRAAELGVLMAAGYRRGTVTRLLLGEGAALALVGGVLGLTGAVAYAWFLLELLQVWWPGNLDRSLLRLHAAPRSFLIGYGGSLLVSLLTIAWATRTLRKVPPRTLLAGETVAADDAAQERKRSRWSRWVIVGAGVGAVACLVAGNLVRGHEAQAGSFFGSGMLLLVACLTGVARWLKRDQHGAITPASRAPLGRLSVRNAARHPTRSLLTAGLLASATFLVVAVESFHRSPQADFLERTGGSGGFALVGESDLPLYGDLNTPKGREDFNLPAGSEEVLVGAQFFPLRLKAGEDASCLNLYQPHRPRVLGVPRQLVERGGFHFAASLAATAEEKANPWLLLHKDPGNGATPVIGEANTVAWMLKSGLGQTFDIVDERGEKKTLRFVALLQESVFQGELLIAEGDFLRLYPRSGGYPFFLIDAPGDRAERVRAALETGLADHGFLATPTPQRVEAFLAVENTYLATFQALGGLGLLLGALGLAVVLLRSVWERRGELALLRALGYRRGALGWLVFAENGFLLILGLTAGTATALVAVSPHLLGGGLPGTRLLAFLALVLSIGFAAGALAVRSALRAPLLPALRRE